MGPTIVRRLLSGAWVFGLLLAGCTGGGFLLHHEAVPKPLTFWEVFDQKAMAEKYSPVLRRLSPSNAPGSGTGCGYRSLEAWPVSEKFFDWSGIQANAPGLAEVLADLMADVKRQAETCGAQIISPPYLELERGTLRKFEFGYKQGKEQGAVIGGFTRLEENSGWRFWLRVERTLPPAE